MRYAGKLSN